MAKHRFPKVRVFGMAILVLLATCSWSAAAQIPQTLNYQGFLTGATGTPLDAPAGVPMTFALFAATGPALYTEAQSVPVIKGVFNVVIGHVTPLTLKFDVPYFLEVTVNGETLAPRQPLASSAYALRSGCIPGDRVTCYDAPSGAPGVNNCQSGTRTCNPQGTGWSACAGEIVPCGTPGVCCPAPQTCGGGVCLCTPTTCNALGRNCGIVGDGCGGLLNCGACPGGQTCGAVNPGVCGTLCGNGIAESGEQCDGADLTGQTCQSFGFSSGSLSCTLQCAFNTSACIP